MSLSYPYRLYPTPGSVTPLGGRYSRPKPVIPVTVIGPRRTHFVAGLLDTGADDTLFPESIAALVGVNLSGAPTAMGTGVGLARVAVRYAEVVLGIAQGSERHEWRAWVAVTSVPLRRPLLGFAGFLQFFTATFHGDREEVELTANALLPGP
jgi:predicted aspartyl protease